MTNHNTRIWNDEQTSPVIQSGITYKGFNGIAKNSTEMMQFTKTNRILTPRPQLASVKERVTLWAFENPLKPSLVHQRLMDFFMN